MSSTQEARPENAAAAADAARKRAALETYVRHEAALRRTARRFSICADDAEDALQRGLEILLRKAPSEDPRELIRWTQTVVKHEALAVRRERERVLAGPAARTPEPDAEDWVALIPADSDGPDERALRHEAIARSREALQALKPQELRALTLLAEGYSYAEIGQITGWTHTKINRCLAEGRERFRKLVSRSEDGRRCAEMQPLLSAFCDEEASEADVARLREHLRACGHCRSTLRSYRAAPAAAAALTPALTLQRPLLERLHEGLHALAGKFGGDGQAALPQLSAGGGAGAAALAKVAAVCVGTAGSAAACVATGVLPAPLGLADAGAPPKVERHRLDAPALSRARAGEWQPAPQPAPAPAPEAADPAKPKAEPAEASPPASATPVPEPAAPPPATEGAPVEYTPPPPEPTPEPAAPAPAPGGSPAGEFGP